VTLIRNPDHYGVLTNADGTIGERCTEGTNEVVTWITKRFAP
jgi:hypothetical protein